MPPLRALLPDSLKAVLWRSTVPANTMNRGKWYGITVKTVSLFVYAAKDPLPALCAV